MTHDRARIALAASILAFYTCIPILATAQEIDEIDRRTRTPPPPEKYKVSNNELLNIGIAFGSMRAFPNKCYGNVSISDEFLNRFKARGFSLETLCLAIQSPWVQYHPETGKPLPVTERFLLGIPDCFRNGKPFLDCKFNYEHTSGLKVSNAGRQVHVDALKIDAAVRRVIASGRYATECTCKDIRWNGAVTLGGHCRVDAAPTCLEQMSRGEYRAGSLVEEIRGYNFENVPTKGFTAYGEFDIAPRLAGGYAYKIGSPEGDDETPYVVLPPGKRIGIGVQ
jgi:hypothetical protein